MNYHLDYETRSKSDLTEVGAFRYANDPSTRILCAAIAEGDNEPVIWRCDKKPSQQVIGLLRTISRDPNAVVFAHNAQFEISISDALFQKTFGLPAPTHNRWRCTAAMGRRAALPASLKRLAEALNLEQQKDEKGGALIRKFSIPQKKTGLFIEPEDEPEAFQEFCDYCEQDVRVEQEIHKKLSAFELKGFALDTFLLDIRINARGFPVNLKALRKADILVQKETERLTLQFRELTGLNPTQGKKFKAWLDERGNPLPNLKAETLEEVLEDADFDENREVGQALILKKRISFASLKKIGSMLACAGPRDNRVRGTLTYHGAGTGRWSASLVQPQNFKRPAAYMSELSPQAYADIIQGCDSEWLAENYGQPLEVVASCIRHFIQDDRPMLSMDYSSIEARLLAWQAQEPWKLEVFKTHGMVYEAAACQMFGMTMQEFKDYKKTHGKHHPMRQKAKSGELGCIAEGQLVLTNKGLIPIERVDLNMLVWDGFNFTKHEGVIYQGIKEVITYENLTATKDHIVFTSRGTMQFGEAAESGSHLIQSGTSRESVRMGKNHLRRKTLHKRLVCSIRASSMSKLRKDNLDMSRKPDSRSIERVPAMLTTKKSPYLVKQASYSHETTLRKYSGRRLSKLWSKRNKVSFSERFSRSYVDQKYSRRTQKLRTGSDRQQWSLRTREFEICHAHATEQEQKNFQSSRRQIRVGLQEKSICTTYNHEIPSTRFQRETNCGVSQKSRERKTEVLATDGAETRRSRVYDIVNCGPRNRFTVSGVLVHNCGYAGGVGALIKMGALKDGLLEAELPEIIKVWRESNPNIVKMWGYIERAAKGAIKNHGRQFPFGIKCSFFATRTAGMNYLFMVLPSGRKIAYPQPEIVPQLFWREKIITKVIEENEKGEKVEVIKITDGKFKKIFNPTPEQIEKIRIKYPKARLGEAITIFSQIPDTETWGRVAVHAGIFCNNQIQGIAGDFMAIGALNADAAGYQIYSLIHDEILSGYAPEKGQSPEELERLMTQLPSWAEGMPLAAEGGVVKFYQK